MKSTRLRRPLQIGTFFRKESIDVLHQPRLLITLVLGPFLIMAVFAIGYRDTPDPLRTLFVAPAGSPLLTQVESYAKEISFYVEYAGVSSDPADAQRRLLNDDIDLIVAFPDDPLGTVLKNEQPVIQVVHTRLDPIERTAITFASQIAVDKINGQVLAAVITNGKALAKPAVEVLQTATNSLTELDKAIDTGDPAQVEKAIADVQAATGDVSVTATLDSALTNQLADASSNNPAVATASQSVTQLQAAVQNLNPTSTAADVAQARAAIDRIRTDYEKFSAVKPEILVRPFGREVVLAVGGADNVTDWYAPAAIVLMLQQFGVAFGALSFVRERQLGIVEVFRVAPISATETLVGKYLAYLAIGGAIGAILTSLVVLTLGVPIATGVADVAIAMGLSLFASIGIGFVISLASRTDAQAVQYTMILLLASLFFSGFFLSVGQMEGVGRWASFLLPVTYGMQLLRDGMLRGAELDRGVMLQLLAYGVVMFTFAWLGTRRRLAVAR
ncbi:MAG: ABC transporter permease [Mycobacteriales bacterium]